MQHRHPHPQGGMLFMDKFVERQNIAHYLEQLETEKDPTKRAMLERLLTEEKGKQASHANVGK
jgi:rubrerythrin